MRCFGEPWDLYLKCETEVGARVSIGSLTWFVNVMKWKRLEVAKEEPFGVYFGGDDGRITAGQV